MAGKHRAEDQPDKKSTSERITGQRNDASARKHAAKDTEKMRGQSLGNRRDANPHIH